MSDSISAQTLQGRAQYIFQFVRNSCNKDIIHSCKDIIVINFKSVKFKPFQSQRMNTKLRKVSKYKYIDLKCNKKINFQVRVTNFIFLKCILKLNNFFREPDDDRFPSCKSR